MGLREQWVAEEPVVLGKQGLCSNEAEISPEIVALPCVKGGIDNLRGSKSAKAVNSVVKPKPAINSYTVNRLILSGLKWLRWVHSWLDREECFQIHRGKVKIPSHIRQIEIRKILAAHNTSRGLRDIALKRIDLDVRHCRKVPSQKSATRESFAHRIYLARCYTIRIGGS